MQSHGKVHINEIRKYWLSMPLVKSHQVIDAHRPNGHKCLLCFALFSVSALLIYIALLLLFFFSFFHHLLMK